MSEAKPFLGNKKPIGQILMQGRWYLPFQKIYG
jgi:hypothetical protein